MWSVLFCLLWTMGQLRRLSGAVLARRRLVEVVEEAEVCVLSGIMDSQGLVVVGEVVIEEVHLLCQWGIGSVERDCQKGEVEEIVGSEAAEEVVVDGTLIKEKEGHNGIQSELIRTV
jgi:hypothetical protein